MKRDPRNRADREVLAAGAAETVAAIAVVEAGAVARNDSQTKIIARQRASRASLAGNTASSHLSGCEIVGT
jgi:hypothetical protein